VAEFKKYRVCGIEVPIILTGLLVVLFVTTVGTGVAVIWKWRQDQAPVVNPNSTPTLAANVSSLPGGATRETVPEVSQLAPRPVDLSRHYNAPLTNAWHFPGGRGSATLRDLPQGVQEFGGVPFEVRGIVQLASARIANRPDYPERISDIPLGIRCRSLHFLHATGWVARDGTPIGSYLVHYADGSTVEIPIVYGQHLREWHGRSDRKLEISDGRLAWDDQKPGTKRRLYQCRWENPKPEAELRTIDFVSAMTDCFPFLIAITAE
jgi:hypothetical protein